MCNPLYDSVKIIWAACISNTINSSSFDTEDVDDNKNGGKGNINHMSIWRKYIIGYINNKHRSLVPLFFHHHQH